MNGSRNDDIWAAPPAASRPAYGPAPGASGLPTSSFGSVGSWAPVPPVTGTNPWAVISLVTGVLALVPIAVVTGAVALVGLRKRPRSGQGAAVTGLVAAAVWSVLLVVGVGFLAGSDAYAGAAMGRVDDVASPAAGVCLRQAGNQGDVATTVSCDEHHDGEVFAVVALPDGPWPGYDTLDDRADEECGGDRYESYVGATYEDSEFEYGWYASDEAEWRAGQREAVCVVLPGFSGLSGSVRDSGGVSD